MLLCAPGWAGEPEARAIRQTLLERHLPYGAVLDPFFSWDDTPVVTGYTRCGDSALWTGAFLAAESYRYAVTGDPDALTQIKNTIDQIKRLIDVTGSDVLARCAYPVDSPYAADLGSQESEHGIHTGILDGKPWFWVGGTSRDQYLGVFFGLTAAYSVTHDDVVKGSVNYVATRLLNNLLARAWVVRMPDRPFTTTFLARPDQQLALLKLGRRANAGGFGWTYKVQSASLGYSTIAPIGVDVSDPHRSYFKFNLDYMTFYMLLTAGDSSWVQINYEKAYSILRNTTDDHGNAFFDIIDRAIKGPRPDRDARIAQTLDEWLTRPRLDVTVDLRGRYPACESEDRACSPIPVAERINTDFLWQRSPFQLYGPGYGRIETAGLDYLLPYWMARYYGVVNEPPTATEPETKVPVRDPHVIRATR